MAADPKEAYEPALSRVDPAWDPARTERALASLHRRRARRRAGGVLGAALLLIVGTTLAVPWPDIEPRPIAVVTASPQSDRGVRLSDGSRVVPEDGARVVVEHVTDTLIALRVDHGAAVIEVVPGLARRFEVSVGAVTVTVLGTVFRVERIDEASAHVSVERGHVDVGWARGHAEVFEGQAGTFPRADVPAVLPAAVLPAAAPPEAVPPEEELGQTEMLGSESRREAPRAPPTEVASSTGWRDLARASRYDEAYEALAGTAERRRDVTDAVDDLLLAADVARLSGHPVEALPWLEAIEHDHPSDSRAVLASFTRGRILMDLGRAEEAARTFEHVLALEPRGSLAEDALARAALARSTAGDAEGASRLAARYLAMHPTGRWTTRVRAIAPAGATTP